MKRHAAPPAVSADLLESAYRLIRAGAAENRSDLRTLLGVSSSTASNIARSLLQQELIRETESASSTGGRPSILLKSVALPELAAVAELGTKHVRYALTDSVGQVSHVREAQLDLSTKPRVAIEALADLWEEMRQELFPENRVSAVGLAIPGPVDARTQRIVMPSRMPGWHDADLVGIVKDVCGVGAVIENDARAAALGESAESGEPDETFIYVKAGSGIGGALVVNGQIYTGSGVAGEVSHVRVVDDSPYLCGCGYTGCLETVASGAAIRREAKKVGVELESMLDLVRAAHEQIPEVVALLRDAGAMVGRALGPLVNFVNPDAVIVGGAMSGLGVFMSALRIALLDFSAPMATKNLRVSSAQLEADSALAGISLMAHRLIVSAHG